MITVTAENGSKNIYKINVKKSKTVEETHNENILVKILKVKIHCFLVLKWLLQMKVVGLKLVYEGRGKNEV